MSYVGNVLDKEYEKTEFQKNRLFGHVTRMAAHKHSSEPKCMQKSHNEPDLKTPTTENFLTKGAFLLTPSYELSMERAAVICEKMSFKDCFSLTKTATGILFKFAHPDDYQAVFKKGFHNVTGARFYRKIPIPCRPRKTFTLYVLDVPEYLPVEDIRHALYKFDSVVEVVRIHIFKQSSASSTDKNVEGTDKSERGDRRELASPVVIRITLASMDEYMILLQNGVNFYDATFFPTEAKIDCKRRDLDGSISGRIRELLPVFDAAGFCKLPPPTSKFISPLRL